MNFRTLATPFALVLAMPFAYAQQPAAAHAPNPHRQTMRLSRELNLSPDQTARIEPIFAERDRKVAALRSDSTLTPEAQKQQMHLLARSTREQMKTVLTPDQLAQLRSIQKARHSRGEQPTSAPTAS